MLLEKNYILTPNEHIGDLNQKNGPKEFKCVEEGHFWGFKYVVFTVSITFSPFFNVLHCASSNVSSKGMPERMHL